MKNETLKKTANIILIIGIVLTLVGAIYIALVQQAYAISGCFILASVLMGNLLVSKKKQVNSKLQRLKKLEFDKGV